MLAPAGLTRYIPGNLAGARGEQSVGGVVVPEHWNWLMQDLERRRATEIIDTAPADIYRWARYPMDEHPALAGYVRSHFERLGEVNRVAIYRRKGCETSQAAKSDASTR